MHFQKLTKVWFPCTTKTKNLKLVLALVLALDASKIILPTNVEIKNEFGSRKIRNQKPKDLGDYASATFAACYDVLNNVAIRSVLDRGNTHEINLADEMLKVVNTTDL